MNKKSNHEEMNKMPIPQKKEETTFTDFVNKNKDLLYKIAKSNTVINESGLTVIPKDDPLNQLSEYQKLKFRIIRSWFLR